MSNFDERIRDLVANAYAYAPAVRWMLDEAGVAPEEVQSADDLAKIPVMSKDALVEIHAANPPFGGFLTIDPSDLPRIYVSPGPIFDPQAPDPENVNVYAPFRYLGLGKGDRVLNTFAYHLTPAGLLFDRLAREMGATVIPGGPSNTEMQVTLMMSIGCTAYAGTPSFLAIILDRAAKMGVAPANIPIRKAAFTAEPYTPSQRALFEGDYGIKTTSIYATADLGLMGYTRENVRGFCITANVFLQICDPETGEPIPAGEVGEIVVTSFNKAYPLIRFGTGDLGALLPDMDADCDGTQQLLGPYGRSGEAIKVRGMFLHPNQIRAAMARIPQVQQLQAIVTRHDHRDVLTLYVELNLAGDGVGIVESVKAQMQNEARLRVDDVIVVEGGTLDPAQRMVRDDRAWD
jgi:phenylacetate-CoA ligase